MSTEASPAYYRLELDDYSAAAFTSFGKYYYGTLDEIRCFFDTLSSNKNHKDPFSQLISAFRAFEAGERDSKHYVAYREVPLLVPVKLLHKEKITLPNHSWEHLNTWRWPYYMRCDKVESEPLWFACDGEYCRAVSAVFTKLQYTGTIDQWNDVGMLWGFPCILTCDSSGFRNRLAEPEKCFKTKRAAQQDWEAFPSNPDPNYSEFCNDIFGDG